MTEYKPVSFCQINPCCSLDRLSPNPCCEVMHMMSSFSCVQLFATLCTIACQAPLSLGFSRQEYCSESPCSPPGDPPNPGTEPRSPALKEESLSAEPQGKPKMSLILSLWSLWYLCFTLKKTSYLSEFMQVIGEGSGTPLQYSCLENPKDRGAW